MCILYHAWTVTDVQQAAAYKHSYGITRVFNIAQVCIACGHARVIQVNSYNDETIKIKSM